MTTKIVTSKPLHCRNKDNNHKFYLNHTYGKPTKPRCDEPSMYEILTWKDNRQELNETCEVVQVRQSNYTEGQQPVSMKNIMHCKSLPADQFVRSKNLNNLSFNPNTQGYQDVTNEEQNKGTKKVNISNHTDYSLNPNKKSQSLKKIPNSTKCIESSQQIRIGDTQNQSHNLDQFKKGSQAKNQQKTQGKAKKLQKKAVPTYTDPEKKPRYMQQKKTAVQKLIESSQFDEEKFEKIKQDEIKRFKQTTRDLSNSAFLTYFNKPPFENYGRENKHSSGVMYGDYMYSHNIFPHTGENHPQKQQTYITALSRAKSAGNIRPHPPLTRHLQEKLITGYLTLSEIYPKDTSFQSIPIKNETVLQKLPYFNYTRPDEKNYPKYSPYLNANENEELFTVENQYLKRDEIPKYFSNKDEIQGKEITYTKKIEPCRK